MRYNKLLLAGVFALIVLPLSLARCAAAAGDQSDPQGFRILLSDGSVLKGAVSFTMNIDTQYGRLTVPSTNFVSARFNSTDGWADIHTTGIQLRVPYKPATSALNATTEVGPVSVDLTKVVTVESLNAETPNPAPPAASNPYDQGTETPSADVYSEPPAIVDLTPYQFGTSASYGWPAYYPSSYCYPYGYACGYPYSYPYFWWPGFGFSIFGDFDRDHYGHHDGFDGRFHDHDSGFAWNRGGARHSAAAADPSASGTAGLSSAASGRTFDSSSRSTGQGFQSGATTSFRSTASRTFGNEGSTTFRSGANRTFSSGGTTTFRSASNRSYWSGGTTTFRSSSPTFRSSGSMTFRSSGGSSYLSFARPSYLSFSAPSFHSSASSSFHSSGMQFSRGAGFSSGRFSSGGGFARSGGFSGGGFARAGGFGGGRGR